MSLEGKKLLILAGSDMHSKVVRTAKEMGIYTIVTDYLEDSPAKALADEAWMLDIMDVDAIVQRCKDEHVDGVMNFCIDPAQLPYVKICEKLDVPCVGTRETFDILTDKRKFKDYCMAHDVDVIPDYTEDDILNDRVVYPLFIKPTDSRGSRGQSICFSKEEAIEGLKIAKNESSDGGYICERFMQGHQDIGSALFVINGEPYLVKLADRFLGRREDNLDKQVMCTSLPSLFSEQYERNVLPRVKKMIKSLGIQFGPVFMQGFVDGDTVRFYDPAQRMPGGDYDVVLKKATGFDTVKSWITFAITGDVTAAAGNPEDVYKLNGGKALLFTFSVRAGRIAKVVGLDELLKHPNVVYGRQMIPAGSEIPNSGDIKQRVAALGTYIANKDEITDFVEEVYRTYHVLDENGEDMIISRYIYQG